MMTLRAFTGASRTENSAKIAVTFDGYFKFREINYLAGEADD